MPAFELPDDLVRDISGDPDHGLERRAWLAGLPAVVDDLACRWSLRLGPPFQPGGPPPGWRPRGPRPGTAWC
jgi:streptomycin 6-kinase